MSEQSQQSYSNETATEVKNEAPQAQTPNQVQQQVAQSTQVTPGTATANTTQKPESATYQSNLQTIKHMKQTVLAFTYTKKLQKLSIYSKCQVRFNKPIKFGCKIELFLYLISRLSSAHV